MVLDVCPALPSERRGDPAGGGAHSRVGQAGPGGPPARGSGAVRHRAGRHGRRTAARRAPGGPSSSTSTATASVACRWGSLVPRCWPTLAATLPELPADRPRYLMGVGDPASLVEAVALGVDQFDCVLPTRLGRHGVAFTGRGQAAPEKRPARPRPTSPSTRPAPVRCAPGTAAATSGTSSRSASRRRSACSRCTTWPGRSTSWRGSGRPSPRARCDELRREVLAAWG